MRSEGGRVALVLTIGERPAPHKTALCRRVVEARVGPDQLELARDLAGLRIAMSDRERSSCMQIDLYDVKLQGNNDGEEFKLCTAVEAPTNPCSYFYSPVSPGWASQRWSSLPTPHHTSHTHQYPRDGRRNGGHPSHHGDVAAPRRWCQECDAGVAGGGHAVGSKRTESEGSLRVYLEGVWKGCGRGHGISSKGTER